MTKTLRQAIDATIEKLKEGRYDPDDCDLFDTKPLLKVLDNLESAYQDHRTNMTETSKRIEFLEECLEKGMSKRDAARKLSEHDPRVGRRTAETLVYTNFSGQYQTTLKGRRLSEVSKPVKTTEAIIPDVSDDESIL